MGDKTFKTASSTAGMVVDYENSALCGNQNNEEDFNEYLDMYENRAHNNLEEDDYYSLFRVSRNVSNLIGCYASKRECGDVRI